jgi:hypothetical protein
MAAGILEDEGGQGTRRRGPVADFLCAALRAGLPGHHEQWLAFEQFEMLQPPAALDEEKGGESFGDFSIRFVDEAWVE